ncbi:hypothetical protein ACFVIN_22210, partial [Streptomyces prasinus]|uniref:KS-MAT linker domain-containing protein n=1 Tax=Streptomyces prasinus TaxID=67345 RepID=UPI00363A69C5
APDAGPAARPVAWPVSARTAEGLRAQAARLRAFAAVRPGPDAARIARTLVTGRAALDHRAVVVGRHDDVDGLLAGLDALVSQTTAASVVRGTGGGGGGRRGGRPPRRPAPRRGRRAPPPRGARRRGARPAPAG